MKLLLSITLTVSLFLLLTKSASALDINLNTDLGPNTRRGTGFHGGYSDNTPDEMLYPLKPQLIRRLGGSRAWDRAFDLNTTVIMLLGNYNLQGNWPSYVNYVTDQVNIAKSKNVSYHYDVWNEPDLSQFWSGSRQDFFNWYRDTFRLLKQLDPTAKVSGPSIAWYNSGYINEFLTFAKANNVVPDILSWHEMGNHTPSGLTNNINSAKSIANTLGITLGAIEINEEIDSGGATRPSVALVHIANVVRNNVFGSARAYWSGLEGSAVAQLNHLLTSNYQPRSVWWVYQKYASMNGNLVSVTYDANLDAVAVKDTLQRKVYVLVGKYGSGTSSVNINNLSSAGISSNQVIINAWRVPDSGTNALTTPVFEYTSTVSTSNGAVSLSTPNFAQNQVYYFEITSTVSPTGSQLQGDLDNDGDVDMADYNLLVSEFGRTGSIADINNNGRVDIFDYSILLTNFGN